jgi:hypothetical protein
MVGQSILVLLVARHLHTRNLLTAGSQNAKRSRLQAAIMEGQFMSMFVGLTLIVVVEVDVGHTMGVSVGRNSLIIGWK